MKLSAAAFLAYLCWSNVAAHAMARQPFVFPHGLFKVPQLEEFCTTPPHELASQRAGDPDWMYSLNHHGAHEKGVGWLEFRRHVLYRAILQDGSMHVPDVRSIEALFDEDGGIVEISSPSFSRFINHYENIFLEKLKQNEESRRGFVDAFRVPPSWSAVDKGHAGRMISMIMRDVEEKRLSLFSSRFENKEVGPWFLLRGYRVITGTKPRVQILVERSDCLMCEPAYALEYLMHERAFVFVEEKMRVGLQPVRRSDWSRIESQRSKYCRSSLKADFSM